MCAAFQAPLPLLFRAASTPFVNIFSVPQRHVSPCPRLIQCQPLMLAPEDRTKIRLAIPSKGDILNSTKQLLSEIGMDVQLHNPRQYVAALRGSDLEVWLQRPADIVRKVRDGHCDLGIVGHDLVAEHGGTKKSVVAVHDRLGYGDCRLSVGVPMAWTDCVDMSGLRKRASMNELRIATKYINETRRFLLFHGIDNYRVIKMDGALEASTQMGTADCIIDLVSSGTTLRENLLKEITGGTLLSSSMQLVTNRSHISDEGAFGERLRSITQELVERIEAHLLGKNNYNIIANIRGSSMVDVSRRLASQSDLRGMDGPTVSPVVPPADADEGMYAISIVLPKEQLYSAIQQLRSVGGSGVTVLPVAFLFPQHCKRWTTLMEDVGMGSTPFSEPVQVQSVAPS
ncbi:Histidine biosynthesis HisG [Gracilaria domingensis]|nr:Histidine biosynthesis HisG [Gracilaria domingensis]